MAVEPLSTANGSISLETIWGWINPKLYHEKSIFLRYGNFHGLIQRLFLSPSHTVHLHVPHTVQLLLRHNLVLPKGHLGSTKQPLLGHSSGACLFLADTSP